jgi:metallo-beta-lactamase family protein
MTIAIEFFGAARHVTGSKHLLHIGDRRLLLDCGMVQGPRSMANRRNRDLGGLDVDRVDAVVLSHAHIDHSGSLPRLVKLGYRGAIHCTEATKDLLGAMLPDSANIQESDARYLRKRGHAPGDVEPAYTQEDVEATLRQTQGHDYHERIEVLPHVFATFFDAGHILGSAIVLIEIEDGAAGPGEHLRVVFTGDLGRRGLPILRDPEPLPEADVLITESTYGNRRHEPVPDLERMLGEAVRKQMQDGGRILIPAFAVGRTQSVVMFLGNLMARGELPRQPIYVDSPLASKATKAVARHADLFDDEVRALLEQGRDPFYFDGVRYVADPEESKTLNGLRSGIIVAASGMCEGGRILHHLKVSLPRKEDAVVFVGFQAVGTLGRRLVDGVDKVRVFGERYAVNCSIISLGGFSAHADRDELLEHLDPLSGRLKHTFVVHGEETPAHAIADALEDRGGFGKVHVPVREDKFVLVP